MNKLTLAKVCLGAGLLGIAAAPARAQGAVISVPAGGDLQAAIDAAAAGDTIQLEPGATYKGMFVLRPKAGTALVTIRTAPDPRQPRDGVRVQPAHAPGLARLISGTSMPAMSTQGAAHHYRLMLLEFGPNHGGLGEIVQLGQADETQTSLDQVPYALVLDRLYIHGDPIVGQKRGVSLNSASTQIVNCYISDIKALGQDTQAIAALNGPGPYLIQNNYLEAAAENFMAGGVDPQIPNLIPSDITFRYNHLFKPTAWRNPIVPAPTGVALSAGVGTLPAGTYAYVVVAERVVAQDATARSAASAEVLVTTVAPGAITVSWKPVPDATSYRVYGRLPGSPSQYWTTTSTSFVDSGVESTAGAPGSASVWSVKNLFELKNARRVVVEGNVMENNWQGGQPGYAIVLTPRNSGGTCTWCTVEEVSFRRNIVRHTSAGVNILGTDNARPSGQTRGITFTDNLFYDVSWAAWGGNGWAVLMGDGPANIVFDHNTIDHDGGSAFYAYGTAQMPGVRITNNLMRHGSYGIFGTGTTGYGTATIDAFFPDGVVTGGVFAGGPAWKYPAGNLFPSVVTHVAQFTNPAAGDYSLIAGSSYASAALDGKDLGANIAEVQAAASMAIRGAPLTGLSPVQITTMNLPRGGVGVPYGAAIAATGGGGQYTWSVTGALPAGVLFDLSSVTLSGIPTQYGTWTIQVAAADATDSSNTATQSLTLSVWPPPVRIPGASLPDAVVGQVASGAIYADGGTGAYRWRIVSGVLPPGVLLNASTGTLSGTATAVGTFAFGVDVTDNAYPELYARGTFSITVASSPVGTATVLLYAKNASVASGGWRVVTDAQAAGGARMWYPDAGASKLSAALAVPANYFEMTFNAEAGKGYRLWLRGRAERDYWGNDSVFVQFSGSVDVSSKPIFRIGTTQATSVNLEECSGCGLTGWGWQDNGWGVGVFGPLVYFGASGPQTIRIQSREDGLSIDQIVLSSQTYLTTSPGTSKQDATILPITSTAVSLEEILVTASSVTTMAGGWKLLSDPSAATGTAAGHPDAGGAKLSAALAAPVHYVEFTFEAEAGRSYRLWLRGRADRDYWGNDSVFVQFSGAVDATGQPIFRIGTTGSTFVNLEDATNAGIAGWGWQDNGYGTGVLGPVIRFASTGPQTLRIQTREDGLRIDQIVLSSQKYLIAAPGAMKNDTTIIP